jgi:hypothetical protein
VIVDNTLDRQFNVAARDRVWVTDITYIRSVEGFAYLAVVIDLTGSWLELAFQFRCPRCNRKRSNLINGLSISQGTAISALSR